MKADLGNLGKDYSRNEVARLQLEAESLREQIRKGIDEWLRLATALELLRQTRESFDSERMPRTL